MTRTNPPTTSSFRFSAFESIAEEFLSLLAPAALHSLPKSCVESGRSLVLTQEAYYTINSH